jgi:hypothetical protein
MNTVAYFDVRSTRSASESLKVDLRYGRKIAAQMKAAGLVEVGAEARAFRWQGGSPGARVVWTGWRQLRGPILATWLVSEAKFEAGLSWLNDPQFAFPSPVMWAAWRRRPY